MNDCETMSSIDPSSLEAFSGLVSQHQAGLRAFIRALGVEADWVDDVAQEVFLVAYRRRARFDNDKDFGRWLRGIARKLVANERRKEARRARLLYGPLTDLLGTSQTDDATGTPLDTERLTETLQKCLGQLSERGRALLWQRCAQQKNATELGRSFKMTPDGVRQTLLRLRLAIKRLRRTESRRNPAMKEDRYHALLARLLDDELGPAEAEELTSELERNPAALEETRRHLVLWDLFAQHVSEERTATAFIAACQTRLQAEANHDEFRRQTREKLASAHCTRRACSPGTWMVSSAVGQTLSAPFMVETRPILGQAELITSKIRSFEPSARASPNTFFISIILFYARPMSSRSACGRSYHSLNGAPAR